MTDLKFFWSEIRSELKIHTDQIDFIDSKLQEAFTAFDAGDKDKGRKAILAIYNLDVKKLSSEVERSISVMRLVLALSGSLSSCHTTLCSISKTAPLRH